MTTQPIWRTLTPLYDDQLSGSSLLARGELFSSGDCDVRSHSPLPPHWHDTYELGFVLEGTGTIVMGQQEYLYAPGQIYIINDFEPHMGYADEVAKLFVLHFHPDIVERGWLGQLRQEVRMPFLPQSSSSGPLLPLDDPITQQIHPLLALIRAEVLRRDPLWDVLVAGLLLQIIGLLARRALQRVPVQPSELQMRRALKSIKPALQLLQDRFREALSLDELARAAGLSKAYCCELFREALGISPIAYRNALRLAEACRLLQSSDLTISAIAYAVGFQSVQELNRLFRRETGCTPSEYTARFRL